MSTAYSVLGKYLQWRSKQGMRFQSFVKSGNYKAKFSKDRRKRKTKCTPRSLSALPFVSETTFPDLRAGDLSSAALYLFLSFFLFWCCSPPFLPFPSIMVVFRPLFCGCFLLQNVCRLGFHVRFDGGSTGLLLCVGDRLIQEVAAALASCT